MKRSKRIITLVYKILPFVFSGAILLLLVGEAENYNFFRSIKDVSPAIVATSLLIFALTKTINVFRYSSLYGIKDKARLFFVLSFCNSLLSIFPFRLGEISYIKYFNDEFAIPKITGVNKLAVMRIFDYMAVYILFLLSSLYVGSNINKGPIKYISLATLAMLFLGGLGIFILQRLKNKKFIEFSPFFKKVKNLLSQSKKEILQINFLSFLYLFCLTTAYWLSRLLFSFVIMRMLGINIGLALIVFVSLFLLLAGLLPVKTFADFGVLEAGWAYFLVSAGYNYDNVFPLLVSYHIVLFIPVLVYGAGGYVFLKISRNSPKKET